MRAIDFNNIQEVVNYTKSSIEKGFVICTTVENVKELSTVVLQNVVLCSTAGEYTTKGYKNGAITGFEYDLNDGEVVEILYPPIKSIDKLKDAYKKVENNKNAFALLLCDGLTGMEEGIITTFYFMHDKFKIIGGSAGDNLKFKETLIYIGSNRVHSVAIFFDLKNRTHIVRENIYVQTGTRLLITEANVINRTVKTFNNRPASTEYARVLGIEESELPKFFINNPLGKIYESDIYIASPMKVNADKSITFYCQLVSNSFVQLLQAIDPVKEIKNTLNNTPFKPSFTFVINCILRSLKFQDERLWPAIDRELIKFCNNTSGFISYGEQFYKNHANQTMVMLLVE
ncbi:FIST C-terminal domain-containing protein [Clostridium sp. PL3]|uniref:FIST C-terminal domain-containing protein n=1 Tax=Clostridium thailandense TaxID=2794346 RepID=A0A949WPY9_9CLOT|nr:FIST N-terminal domain-containing protein [Clostridium thailandense]MBV7271985.1 FIST C-terminal domain-containing protein [Clostridium thailandense]